MLSYSFYETDNRVRRYAETLAKQGYSVDAYALRLAETQPTQEIIKGVTVHRLQSRQKDERGPIDHLIRLCRFSFRVAWHLVRNHRIHAYDLIHVHNPPDFLVFATLLPKLAGAKIILDIHDIVPELYGNKFVSSRSSLLGKALRWVERLSMRFADHVIVSNHLWHEKIVARSVSIEKTSVLVNHVDPTLFYRRSRNVTQGKFVLLFPGSLSWHQGLDIAIDAFSRIRDELPTAEFHIYGVGSAKRDLVALVKKLGLADRVLFREIVPLHQVGDLMAGATVGVVPKRADSFGNEAYSTKIMEFMSQGTPVIVSRTKIDSYYFDDSLVAFFEPANADELAARILRIARDEDYRNALSANGLRYADENSWDNKKHEYLSLVTGLINRPSYSIGMNTPAAVSDAGALSPQQHSISQG